MGSGQYGRADDGNDCLCGGESERLLRATRARTEQLSVVDRGSDVDLVHRRQARVMDASALGAKVLAAKGYIGVIIIAGGVYVALSAFAKMPAQLTAHQV